MKNPTPHPMHEPERPCNRSFLLRLWQTGAGAANWQASLEIPGAGERIGFANLERLFAYLLEVTEGDAGAETQDNPANPLHLSRPE